VSYQPRDLMPVKVVRVNLGQRRGDAETPELWHAPVVHVRLAMLDRLVAGVADGGFHRSARYPRRIAQGQARGKRSIQRTAFCCPGRGGRITGH
jgi:hypothetical protein